MVTFGEASRQAGALPPTGPCPRRPSTPAPQTMSLQPSNRLARDPANRRRLYEATADLLEEKLGGPLPNRLPAPGGPEAAAA